MTSDTTRPPSPPSPVLTCPGDWQTCQPVLDAKADVRWKVIEFLEDELARPDLCADTRRLLEDWQQRSLPEDLRQ